MVLKNVKNFGLWKWLSHAFKYKLLYISSECSMAIFYNTFLSFVPTYAAYIGVFFIALKEQATKN
jgi:hypothetical protein